MKVAFIDRDGTIVKDYPDDQWRHISEPEYLEGAIEGLKGLQEMGYRIIIITNQYIIGDGYIQLNQYENFTSKLIRHLEKSGIEVLDIFYCPHNSDAGCDCRKPRIGMLSQAVSKYNDIVIAASLMIGDSECDHQFAEAGGLSFYGIANGSIIDQDTCYKSIEAIALNIYKSK